MSFLTVSLNPALTTVSMVPAPLYTVTAVTPLVPRADNKRRRNQQGGEAGQRRATVPGQTTRGTLRDIIV